MKRKIILISGLLAFTLFSLFSYPYIRGLMDEHRRFLPWGATVDVSVLPHFISNLEDSSSLVILEGLPHHNDESELFEKEISTKQHIILHDFPFYPRQIKISAEDQSAINLALTRAKALEEWMGPKLCGGYHPDYALRWEDGSGKIHEALICFGCSEIRFYIKHKALYTDMTKETHVALEKILSQHQIQRPKISLDNKTLHPIPSPSRSEPISISKH